MASSRNTPTQRLTKIMEADMPFLLTVHGEFAEKFHLGYTPHPPGNGTPGTALLPRTDEFGVCEPVIHDTGTVLVLQ